MQTSELACTNRFLAALAPADLEHLVRHLVRVPLIQGDCLFEPEDEITHVHFPLRGMISIVAIMQDGRFVETATVGPEGAVGVIQALGTGQVFWRGIVQLPGEALRIERSHLVDVAKKSEALRDVVGRYTEAFLMQVLQLVACNALHPVEARLARWLLTSRTCVEGSYLPLTQEFLAEMLGVNRTTVTQIARALQRNKVMTYRRGQVRILDQRGLKDAACECHSLIHRRFDVLLPPINS